MSRPSPAPPAIAALLAELIDDAGLFPPASLPIDRALIAHAGARRGEFSWMLGRFVCPAGALLDVPPELAVSVIVDGADELARALETGRRIEAVEARPVSGDSVRDVATALRDVATRAGIHRIFQEVPFDSDAIAALHDCRVGAKLRCGGTIAGAFPSSENLAAAIIYAVALGVPIKATAGLHHPIRRWDGELAAWMHGFLNLLAAVIAAADGADPTSVTEILDITDERSFVINGDQFGVAPFVADADAVRRVRSERFVGFGSCSFDEPITDLISIGVLDTGAIFA